MHPGFSQTALIAGGAEFCALLCWQPGLRFNPRSANWLANIAATLLAAAAARRLIQC